MHVNNEIGNLGAGLVQAIQALASGGRMAVISYHSVEDRVVKETFRREASDCICPPEVPECVCDHKPTITRVNRRVIKPSPQEVHANPRSRSARLRVAERIPARRTDEPEHRDRDAEGQLTERRAMTQDSNVLAAIDVGTSKVCTIIAGRPAPGRLNVLGYSVVPSRGLEKGQRGRWPGRRERETGVGRSGRAGCRG